MADNIIQVNVTANKPKSVTVSSAQVGTEITASSDTGRFWAQTSKNWAVSDTIVDNTDYSSKYYANKAKESATNANNTFDSIRDTYQDFQEESNNAFNELNSSKAEGLEQIDVAKNNAIDSINTTKTTIITDIEFVADGEKQEIEDLANLIKDNAEEIASRTSFAMFDTILKDHVLTYEESKGLALQGTWVYKEAIAGSRYGYADFYNKCLEEYNESEVYYLPWVQPIATGATTAIDGGDMVITTSNEYSTYNAYKAMDGVSSGTTATTGWGTNNTTAVQWWQVKFPYKIRITGLTGYQRQDSTPANANTIGQFYTSSDKTTPIGDTYNNAVGVNWNAVSVTGIPAEGIVTDTIYFEKTGGGSHGGLGELKIEATDITPFYKNTNGHIFYNIADKDSIDELFASTGMAWMYGVDTENERIFLPRNNYFALTGGVMGNGMSLGFTNGTTTGALHSNTGGAVVNAVEGYGADVGTSATGTTAVTGAKFLGVTTDPTNSGITLESDTDKYLYICVGNTVADTSWVDVVTQVKEGVKDIEEAKDEAIDAMKNVVGGTVPLGFIGSAILGIDETLGLQRYLNGQIILQDQFKGFTKYLKRRVELYPSLACTEDEWQTTVTMSAFSQCGKFVIDDNAGTIRLPKVVNIQGLTDLSKLGEIVEAGLPNITGSTSTSGEGKVFEGANGAFYGDGGTGRVVAAGSGNYYISDTLYLDASRSNPIYGKSNTVQQEQIQYPYFIQVATGAETEDNIINEIELNNPFSLLDYKYSEYELNNLSWLRSNGQWNSKAVYPAVYDLLLKIYNGTETKAGVSVKLSTEEYTDYDFVLNTAEETFRLPIKVKLASGKAVVGNGNSVGMLYSNDGSTVIEGGFRYKYDKDSSGFNIELATIGLPVVTPAGAQYTSETALANTPKNGTAVGITTDPTKSGIETSDSDLYLYFYVGETVQNANLINAGRIEEHLHSLIPDNSSSIAWYGMPDYSAGVSKSVNIDYAEATNGCLIVDYTSDTNSEFGITINGTSFRFYQGYSGTDYNHCNVGFIPIPKNTTYKITIGNKVRIRYFPCIGG